MVHKPEIFDVSGPVHLLNCCDWGNASYRRSVTASLVQGVYSMEREHKEEGSSSDVVERHASQWWERFHFQLIDRLVDESDSSYFGAIYELTSVNPPDNAPKYVIAFRGTIISKGTFKDVLLDLEHVCCKFKSDSRIQTACEAVSDTVNMAGGRANVWLAGHSLGASIAMLAGREMVKDEGIHLETFLFNPPFISVPIEMKRGGRIIGSFLKAGIATAFDKCREEPLPDPFVMLSEWTPNVFVNRCDPICEKYIGYFEHRDRMESMGLGKIERIATRFTFRSLGSSAVGRDLEAWHIVPTAYMTENLSPMKDFRQDHGIAQWWQQHLQCHGTLYKLKTQ